MFRRTLGSSDAYAGHSTGTSSRHCWGGEDRRRLCRNAGRVRPQYRRNRQQRHHLQRKSADADAKITVGGTELVAGTDFRMEYSNNVHAGTGIAYILGMGKYAGYVDSCEFTIHPAQLVVKVDDVQDVKDPASYTYTILQGTLASGDSLGQPQYSVKDNGNSTKTVSATFQDNADYEITVLPVL